MAKHTRNPYKVADHYTREAKSRGYPARSVFKLEEIDKRLRLLKPAMRVLDLGAAPGSWTLYVAQKVGAKGHVLAIDQTLIEVPLPAHVVFLHGDALALESDALATFAPYHVVLSDMAPSTTGNRLGDQTRSYELFTRALSVAEKLLLPGGAFVGKIFMGEDFQNAKAEMKKVFRDSRTMKPEAARASSYEIFLAGLDRKRTDELF
ncbi:MAG: RlmE family RNA methyltransferase [Polyangiaceae bacterium]|nr:RlmE family RNA methyltransferase [Polyangiaceae bacterium]